MDKKTKIKVLLAEDNEVNRLLLKSMLLHWGYTFTMTVTGSETIAAVEKEDFDIILMDIHMPDKNGMEAAIEIRGMENDKKNCIPIIALTANGLIGEEKKYLEAGIDDYLNKPFKQKELYDAIERVLNNRHTFGNRFPNPLENNNNNLMSNSAKLYDLTLINEIARGNEEFIRNLTQIFIDTIPQSSKEMVEAATNNNPAEMGRLAHKLKSTIDTMQILSIKEDIRMVEQSGKQMIINDSIIATCNKINDVIAQVTADLKTKFGM